jgi:hypothetical protein
MEMDTSFLLYGRWEGVKEKIHEHCLSSSDITIKVKAFWGIGRRGNGHLGFAVKKPSKLGKGNKQSVSNFLRCCMGTKTMGLLTSELDSEVKGISGGV